MGWYSEPYWVRLPQILTGTGTVGQLGEIVKRLGMEKALIVTDTGIVKAGLIDKIKEPLTKEGIDFGVFDGCQPNAPVSTIKSCAEIARKGGYDLLIGVGGGSTLDTTKLASIAATAKDIEADIREYPVSGLSRRGLPKILIPTTAGTGSEASNAAVLTDQEGLVRSTRGEYGLADIAIIDPAMTQNLPPRLTAETGVDAFSHAFEAYINPRAHVLSETLDEMAIRLIAANLRPAYYKGSENVEARYNMAVAATYAMASIPMSGAGLPHALGHALQSVAEMSHGVSLAILLPHIMEFNLSACPAKYARVAELMGERTGNLSAEDSALKAIDAVKKLLSDVGMTNRLRDTGLKKQHLPRIVEILFEFNMRNVRNNPRQVTRADAAGILEAAW